MALTKNVKNAQMSKKSYIINSMLSEKDKKKSYQQLKTYRIDFFNPKQTDFVVPFLHHNKDYFRITFCSDLMWNKTLKVRNSCMRGVAEI